VITGQPRLLLTAAVAANEHIAVQGYEIEKIAQYENSFYSSIIFMCIPIVFSVSLCCRILDFINVMT
jgi:hypothetical protein